MSWLDLFRRRPKGPPINVTRGEDVALFAPPDRGVTLQMQLGREGWNSRVFASVDDGIWEPLARNVPVALVVFEGVDAAAVESGAAGQPTLTDVPLVRCGAGWADHAPAGALVVPTDAPADLARALDALRER